MQYARRTDRTAAELIREAMELFRIQRIHPRTSLTALKPLDLGKALKSFSGREDLLGEMLE